VDLTAPAVGPALKAGGAQDRGDLRLTRGGVIAGRVTDSRGDPVTEATVFARQVTYPEPGRRTISSLQTRSALTNDLGEYRVYGLRPGVYYVSANMPTAERSNLNAVPIGQLAATAMGLAMTHFPSTTIEAEAQPVAVTAGEQSLGIDIQMKSIPLARISGRVIDSAGRPGADMVVMIASFQSGRGTSVRTDHQGAFTANDIAPGENMVNVVTVRVMEVIGASGTARFEPDEKSEFFSRQVNVTGDITGFVAQTTAGFDVRGRVLIDGGRPSDESGVKLSIAARPPVNEGPVFVPFVPAEVLADGSFVLRNVADRRFISISGLPSRMQLAGITVNGRDVTDDPVDVTGPLAGVEVRLTTRTTTVTGTVKDREGNAVPAGVIVFSEDRRLWMNESTRFVKSASHTVAGGFTFSRLPPGRYFVAGVDQLEEGQWASPENLERLSRLATLFTLGEGETKTLALTVIRP